MPDEPLPTILPLPQEMTRLAGELILTSDIRIQADLPNRDNAAWLRGFLDLSPDTGTGGLSIRLETGGDADLPSGSTEGYALDIDPQGIRLRAPHPVGVFHGLQTLRQFLPPSCEQGQPLPESGWRLPCLHVRDWPRFAWRGFMLDDSRHFHGLETVKRYLDLMGLLKLNTFHWHLSDDQGWRIQVERFPNLTETGAWRTASAMDFFGRTDGKPHGGFYSQEQIGEVVEYARQRAITVVPEVDLPGHARALLASHPHLGCTGGPYQVAQRIGILPDLLCAGRESTYDFIEDLLDEIVPLFPGPWFHVGGDETPLKRWRHCPDCQGRIQREHLGDEAGLKVYFINRLADMLAKRGKMLTGYSEVLKPGLAPEAVVQHWVGKPATLLRSIREGRQVIMSTYMQTYLDHSYALTPLSKAYLYEPLLPGIEPELESNVLGLEALLWSEFVPDRKRLDYQVFPRLCAYSETGWTSREAKGLADFQSRLAHFESRLDAMDIAYARPWQAQPPWYKRLFGLITIAQPQRDVAD